jgi:hypothetical protein
MSHHLLRSHKLTKRSPKTVTAAVVRLRRHSRKLLWVRLRSSCRAV